MNDNSNPIILASPAIPIEVDAVSLEDTDNLPAPEVIAAEIVEDLRSALEEFEALAESLATRGIEIEENA